jgi:hypothetical protein
VWIHNPAQDLWLEKPGGGLPQPRDPNTEIKLVTLTIGGNDAGFANIANACVQGPRADNTVYSIEDCQTTIANNEAAGFAAIRAKLPVVLRHIHSAAPNARIRIPLYPRVLNLFQRQIIVATRTVWGVTLEWRVNNVDLSATPPPQMQGMTAAQSLEQFIGRLNLAIKETVNGVRNGPNNVPDVKVIEGTEGAFDGHRLGDLVPWINGVLLPEEQRQESFHPNLCGQKALARLFLQVEGEGVPPARC